MIVRFDEDIILAKVGTIRRCIEVVGNVWFENDPPVPEWVRLDVTVLNLQRAIEACLDMANHLIAFNSWGLPGSAAEAIQLLTNNRILPAIDAKIYRGMIGFRNIAVHNYREIEEGIVSSIVNHHLQDLEHFATLILNATVNRG